MPRKRAAKKPVKNSAGGVGCLALIALVVIASIFRSPTDKKTNAPTNISARAVVSTQRPSPTTVRPSASATARPAPIAKSTSAQQQFVSQQVQTTNALSVTGDGIFYEINGVAVGSALDGVSAKNGVIVLVLANFISDTDRCVHGWDFKLVVSGQEYDAETSWMNKFKPKLDSIDYPGWGIGGQCMTAGQPEPTFLAFDVPATGEGPSLRFFTGQVFLGAWETLAVTSVPSLAATSTLFLATAMPIPSGIPALTQTPFKTVHVNAEVARFRACPRLDCEVVQALERGVAFDVVEVVEGAAFSGSTTWYRTIVNGRDAYVHASLITIVQLSTPVQVATVKAVATPHPTEVQPTNLITFASPRSWYAAGNVNIRRCPATTCAAIDTLSIGDVIVLDASANGGSVSGSTQWYRVRGGGYVHSSVVSASRPSMQQPGSTQSGSQPTSIVPPTSGPMSTPTQGNQWVCSGNQYNCGDFNRSTLHSYWAACPGDPSRLDGDDDGIPCEDIW